MRGRRWKRGAVVACTLVLGACSLVAGLDDDGFAVGGSVGPVLDGGGGAGEGGSSEGGIVVVDGSADFSRCATGTSPLTLPQVLFYFVYDNSGSTGSDGKSGVMRPGMAKFFDTLAARGRPNEHAGLLLYGGEIVESPIVPFDAKVAKEFDAFIGDAGLKGAGRTVSAMDKAFTSIGQFVPRADDRTVRWLILLSDGVPSGEALEGGVAGAERAIEELVANRAIDPGGTRVFVIGFGQILVVDGGAVGATDYDPAFLGRLAIAGRTAPAGCVVDSAEKLCHLQVDSRNGQSPSPAQFEAVLASVLRTIGECTITLGDAKIVDGTTNVAIEGDAGVRLVPLGGDDGWSYDAPSNRLTIRGPSCQAISTSAVAPKLVFGCPTVSR